MVLWRARRKRKEDPKGFHRILKIEFSTPGWRGVERNGILLNFSCTPKWIFWLRMETFLSNHEGYDCSFLG